MTLIAWWADDPFAYDTTVTLGTGETSTTFRANSAVLRFVSSKWTHMLHPSQHENCKSLHLPDGIPESVDIILRLAHHKYD
jgi:hypothetical protein